MQIHELTNLYVGYNKSQNFRVLICADDIDDAKEIAFEYRRDAQMNGSFEITEFTNLDTHFDCDYVLTKEDNKNDGPHMEPKLVKNQSYYERDCTMYGCCPNCGATVHSGIIGTQARCHICKCKLIWK